jgi:uncharacterized protein YjiS (DUF1127 family)
MAQLAAHYAHAAASTRHPSSLLRTCWEAFQQRRERQKMRAALYELSDRELTDFAIARCDIEYVASHRTINPREG